MQVSILTHVFGNKLSELCVHLSRFFFRGFIGPGGIGEGFPSAYNCTGGMAGYIDRIALGNHIYRFPTLKVVKIVK